MSQTTKQLAVRLPLDLHAQIVATAAENNRSGHAEMLYRLEQSFQDETGKLKALAVKAGLKALEDTMTQTIGDGLNALEERLLKRLAPETFVTSVEIHGGAMSPSAYDELAKAFEGVDYSCFESRLRRGTTSPTGRLSDTAPELQDLPAVSGISTLAASLKARGCMCEGGVAGFHSGGYVSSRPAHEIAAILSATNTVNCDMKYEKAPLPLAGQEWVITGSLETMTRDRAREILMELGAVVVGSVNPATAGVVWGPGAGSKLEKANQYGVTTWNEFLFIEMIRGFGVDMPLPKSNIQLLVTPGALEWDSPGDDGWTENTGSMPVQPKTVVEWRVRGGSGNTPEDVQGPEPAGALGWTLEGEPDAFDIIYWRLAK